MTTNKITGEIDVESIKRCYVNTLVSVKCPNCDSTLVNDLREQYLSHPLVGETNYIHFYCEECDDGGAECEFTLPIQIISANLIFEYDKSDIKNAK